MTTAAMHKCSWNADISRGMLMSPSMAQHGAVHMMHSRSVVPCTLCTVSFGTSIHFAVTAETCTCRVRCAEPRSKILQEIGQLSSPSLAKTHLEPQLNGRQWVCASSRFQLCRQLVVAKAQRACAPGVRTMSFPLHAHASPLTVTSSQQMLQPVYENRYRAV